MSFAAMMAVALALDAMIGWPDRLHKQFGHPVMWVGALIAALDARLNREGDNAGRRKAFGLLSAGVTVLVAVLPFAILQWLLPPNVLGVVLGGVFVWPLIAARSLYTHVAAVATPLGAGDVVGARLAVSQIVGRDPEQLDAPGIARAGLESLAENTSDGVVAPLFWGAIAGLPGIAAYKAINTLDSMIGHRTPRHEAFGWAAARIDDLVNLIPARLTGAALVAVSPRPAAAFGVMRRDARWHRSPNAGWPEAALAGGLGIRLSGPRVYADRVADEPWLNADAPDPKAADMMRGLALYVRAMLLCGAVLVLLAVM